MATLGQQLKAAREAKGVSESDAGSATRTLTKVIRAMEADDFSVMPAGFIRLYAEYLGLDPAPLVDDYLANHAAGPRPFINESSQLEQNSRTNKPVAVNLQKIFVKIPHIALPFFQRLERPARRCLERYPCARRSRGHSARSHCFDR